MFDSTTVGPAPAPPPAPAGSAAALLDAARGHRQVADRAEADLLATALAWADLHPAESIEDAATLIGYGEHAVAIAGRGAPLVAEFCLAEYAAALGLRTEQGRDLVGEVLELAHRLPKIWHSIQNGTLPAWRGRRIARATMHLSAEAAAHVDRHLYRYAHRVGVPTIDRLVAEAITLFMPAEADRQAREAADRRCVDIDPRTVSFDGTCQISGELDLADALDLDTALDTGADALAAAGADQTKQVLRAVALGDLARGRQPLPFGTDTSAGAGADSSAGTGAGATGVSTGSPPGGGDPDDAPPAQHESVETPTRAPQPTTVAPRQVVLHVHLSEAALHGSGSSGSATGGIARLEGTASQGGRHLLTVEQVRGWCRTAGTVTIKPVIDTTGHLSVEAYEIPDRLTDQVAERDVGCRFPWCDRPAHVCDIDHVVEHARGGPTASDNLAPLCRHHHRIKTVGRWRYTMVEPGTYLWTSPHAASYLVDPTGTRTL